jgi:hypothetical protein
VEAHHRCELKIREKLTRFRGSDGSRFREIFLRHGFAKVTVTGTLARWANRTAFFPRVFRPALIMEKSIVVKFAVVK